MPIITFASLASSLACQATDCRTDAEKDLTRFLALALRTLCGLQGVEAPVS